MTKLSHLWTDFRTDPLGAIRDWQNARTTWLIMLLTAVFLESVALYFQYVMYLDPCELCVYQRLAVLLIGLAALVMLVVPRNKLARGLGYIIWIAGAAYGLDASIKMLGYYTSADLFMTCKALPSFPFDLPLYDWWPQMFLPSGFCGQDGWLFLGMNMAHWMTFIFGLYILAYMLCLISLFRKSK
ncbi:disulfide bond formation protein DsbB [Endozoicomonas sp. ALD040]|uniref:disulfide bond formation protein DsbB n=1 Tax=Endozoicomonas sp. ALD040 TaxID=3403079 RepID=UPI003BAF2044